MNKNEKIVGLTKVNTPAFDPTLFIDMMQQHDLSAKQFLLLSLLITKDSYNLYRYTENIQNARDKNGNLIHEKEIQVIINNSTTVKAKVNTEAIGIEDLELLEERGWIKRNADFEKYLKTPNKYVLVDCFDVTDKAISKLWVKVDIAAKEVYDNYPKWMEINGKDISTLTISYEDFCKLYAEYLGAKSYIADISEKHAKTGERIVGKQPMRLNIGWLDRHVKVMKGLEKYKKLIEEDKIGNVGIEKFIKNRVYESVIEIDNTNMSLSFNE